MTRIETQRDMRFPWKPVIIMIGLVCAFLAISKLSAQFKLKRDDFSKPLPPWEEGMLDLHHINTGSGNAAFYTFPDGTTLLIDAGEAGDKMRYERVKIFAKYGPRRPSNKWTSGESIANYIKQVAPRNYSHALDFAVVTHYHTDHYGDVDDTSKTSPTGKYLLSGVTEVDHLIPINKLFDRGYPAYNFPVPLKKFYKKDKTFQNYLQFVQAKGSSGKMEQETLNVGKTDQIKPLRNPNKYADNFKIRCVKKEGEIWNGSNDKTTTLFDAENLFSLFGDNKFNENPLSIALHFTYGPFRYFTGGDMSGLQGYSMPDWYDTETPTTKAVGQVDVTTLNHHGNRDGTNVNFVKNLQPQVVVQQAWSSDHPGMESFYRLISKDLYTSKTAPDIFSIFMHDNVLWTYGEPFLKAYQSMFGHVLVRVMPLGQEFMVYVLDDTKPHVTVKAMYGPYKSKGA